MIIQLGEFYFSASEYKVHDWNKDSNPHRLPLKWDG